MEKVWKFGSLPSRAFFVNLMLSLDFGFNSTPGKSKKKTPLFPAASTLNVDFIVDYRIFVPVTLDCLVVCSECLNAFLAHFWTDEVCVMDAETDDPVQLLSLQSFVVHCLHERTMSFRFDASLIVCLFGVWVFFLGFNGKRRENKNFWINFLDLFHVLSKKRN